MSHVQHEYIDLNDDSDNEVKLIKPQLIQCEDRTSPQRIAVTDEDLTQNLDNQYKLMFEGAGELHTCSSDEQLKTGEVTLECPDENRMYQNMKKNVPQKSGYRF